MGSPEPAKELREIDRLLAEGAEAWARGDRKAAHDVFRAAQRKDGNDPRVLSWLGLSSTLFARDEYRGLALSEEAIRRGGEDPEALYRLALVYEHMKQRQRAVRAIRRGLELQPDHVGHIELMGRFGVRRPPVLPFLSRSNPLNKLLGRLRHRMILRREQQEK